MICILQSLLQIVVWYGRNVRLQSWQLNWCLLATKLRDDISSFFGLLFNYFHSRFAFLSLSSQYSIFLSSLSLLSQVFFKPTQTLSDIHWLPFTSLLKDWTGLSVKLRLTEDLCKIWSTPTLSISELLWYHIFISIFRVRLKKLSLYHYLGVLRLRLPKGF